MRCKYFQVPETTLSQGEIFCPASFEEFYFSMKSDGDRRAGARPFSQDDSQELLQEEELLQGWERVYPTRDLQLQGPSPAKSEEGNGYGGSSGEREAAVGLQSCPGDPTGEGEGLGVKSGTRKTRRHANVELIIR